MRTYNKLYRFNTFHNDRNYKLTVTGYDLLGNKMFNKIETYHKLGEFVSFDIPEFANYIYEYIIDGVKYNDEPHVKFCIEKDSNIDVIYSHVIYSHIDITDQDDKVVFCGPTYENMHNVTYCVRTKENINKPAVQTGTCKNLVNVPCLIESMQYTYRYPVVDGYYTLEETTPINIYPHIILNKRYWKIKSLIINYWGEDGELLYTIDDIELTEENMKANVYTHTVTVEDEDHYWDGEPTIDIKLNQEENVGDVYLTHYRYAKVRHNKVFDSANREATIETEELDILNADGTLKFKIGEVASATPKEYDGYYLVDGQDFTGTVSAEDKYTLYIDVDYYKYIKFTMYPIWYENIGTEETPVLNPQHIIIAEPEVIEGMLQGVTYRYVPIEVPGYYPKTEFVLLNSTVDKIMHIVYGKDEDEPKE